MKMNKLDLMIQISYIESKDKITGKYQYAYLKTLTKKQLQEIYDRGE